MTDMTHQNPQLQEGQFREMFERSRAIQLLLEAETAAIHDANPAAVDFYGLSAHELCTRRLHDLCCDPMGWVDEQLAAIRGGSTTIPVLQQISAEGCTRTVELFASSISGGDRDLLHVIVYDVTARAEALGRIAGLAELGRRLGAAKTTYDAGRVLVDVADKMIGWDACFVDLFASEVDQQVMMPGHLLVPVVHMDIVKGKRREVQPLYTVLPAGSLSYTILQEGPKLVLRREGDQPANGFSMFGDEKRPSMSLMYAPIRGSHSILGVFSIQSYRVNAYKLADLDLLSTLADHCAGALERTRAEEQVRLLESAVRLASDMVIITSADPTSTTGTRIAFVNDAVLQMTGYTREELVGRSISILQGPETNRETLENMHRALAEGKAVKVEVINYRKDRTPYVCEFSAYSICDEYGRPRYFVSVQRDITERKRTELDLTYRAFHDTLTDLANRALLLERLQHAIARSTRSSEAFAVLFLDLDGFKEVNDKFGHHSGDQLLVLAARRLETCVRPGDTVARLGGDEFVILLEGIENLDQATRIAERILEGFQAPFVIRGQQIICTASIGIAQQPPQQVDAAEILKLADMALYQAKANGKSRYQVFSAS